MKGRGCAFSSPRFSAQPAHAYPSFDAENAGLGSLVRAEEDEPPHRDPPHTGLDTAQQLCSALVRDHSLHNVQRRLVTAGKQATSAANSNDGCSNFDVEGGRSLAPLSLCRRELSRLATTALFAGPHI